MDVDASNGGGLLTAERQEAEEEGKHRKGGVVKGNDLLGEQMSVATKQDN